MTTTTAHRLAGSTQREIVSRLTDSFLRAVYHCQQNGGGRPTWSRYADIAHPAAAAAFDVEVKALMKRSRPLRQALGKACARGVPPDAATRAHVAELLEHELEQTPAHALRSFEALLGMDGESVRAKGARPFRLAPPSRPVSHGGATRRVKRVVVPLVLLNAIILATLGAGSLLAAVGNASPPTGPDHLLALYAFAIWALSFIPGWLLVRFLDRRAGALWDEYVIHLHRLGLDRPENLPEPPKTSAYYAAWRDHGGLARSGLRNIYQEKFDAYYGKSVSRFGTDEDHPVRSEALFPVFLCTAVLAVGWTAIFYNTEVTLGAVERSAGPVLSFAFMGAYLYFVQGLMRRYFQADLRAGAYVSGYVRIVSAIVVAAVLYVALSPVGEVPAEAMVAVAFTVGWFPEVGIKWLLRVTSRRLRGAVPSVEPAYPLNRLDGLNAWYESRLLEEGIEDLQNLATAKLVDVLLHTRVPVARLVDWVDQALLLIHLPAEPLVSEQQGLTHRSKVSRAVDQGSGHPRLVLRSCGIRSATSLLRALHHSRPWTERSHLLDLLEDNDLSRAAVESLYQVLLADPRLAVVVNWQEGDAEARIPIRLGPLPTLTRGPGG